MLKRVGGNWLSRARKQIDGDKFVCLDQLLKKDNCIVYSFGVNNDWTFEDRMDAIGLNYIMLPVLVDPRESRSRSLISALKSNICIEAVKYLPTTTRCLIQLGEERTSSTFKPALALEKV